MVKGVGFVSRLDDPGQAVNRQIHQAQLGVVLHLLLAVKGHGVVGQHPGVFHKVASLDEHPAAATGRVQQDALPGFQNVDDHLYQGLGGKEHPVILGDVFGKLVEKILIDAPDHVAPHIVQGAVVEDPQQFGQQLVGEHGVILG